MSKKMYKYRYPLLLLILFFSIPLQPLSAADSRSPVFPLNQRPEINFEHLTAEDGLPAEFVCAGLQDSHGFLWFGTMSGLCRYDGSEFKVYTKEKEGLSNNYIWSLYEDRQGLLWVGTYGGGLHKFDPQTETFTSYQFEKNNPHSIGSNLIESIYQDKQGILWVATHGGGLNKFNPENETFSRYLNDPDNPRSLSHNHVTKLLEDKNGDLWIGTYGGGLNKFDPQKGEFSRFSHDEKDINSLSNDFIWSICLDSEGTLWFGTQNGLNRFDQENERFTSYINEEGKLNSLSNNAVLSIIEESPGVFWLGTYGGGLNKFQAADNSFYRYKTDPTQTKSISNNVIWKIVRDDTGAFWFCTEKGINKYDPGAARFSYFGHNPLNPNSLNDNLVYAVYQDKDDIIWLGTHGGGLNKFDRKANKFVYYRHDEKRKNSISDDHITTIKGDNAGNLWIGTLKGLNKFEPKKETFTSYKHNPDNPNSLNGNNITDIAITASGSIWIAMNGGGLDKFEPGSETFTHHKHDDNNDSSLVSDYVFTVLEDAEGEIWAGTVAGLSRLKRQQKTFTNYQHDKKNPNSLSDNSATSMYQDNSGAIWIGTGGALNKFDKRTETFTRYRKKQGLPGNMIFGISEDHLGRIWIGTNKGLSIYEPKDETFKNYDSRDGLEGNLLTIHSFFKGSGGEIFFGGSNGFNAAHPERMTDNSHIPAIVLTDFQLFRKSVPIGPTSPLQKQINLTSQITLNHEQSVFGFSFAALSYRFSAKNRCAYMLEGFDKEWIEATKKNSAIYTNLDAGDYIFRVKGANNDGIWNEEGTSVNIKIIPPWWKTGWFRGSLLLIIIGLTAASFRWRVRTIKKRNSELATQVAKKTAELTKSNKELSLAKEKAEVANRAKSEFLANMSHELRTPLNAVTGFSELLSSVIVDKKQKKYLKAIKTGGKSLLILINDILDLSKVEAGKMIIQNSPLSLFRSFKEIEQIFELKIKKKNLHFSMNIAQDVPETLLLDEARLRQILLNIVGNAVKFTETGNISLTAKMDSAGKTNNKTDLLIAIKDTGTGIPAAEQEAVFAPFRQREGQNNHKYGGTGLGLTISRKLTEAMNGRLELKNTAAEGSTFEVIFPDISVAKDTVLSEEDFFDFGNISFKKQKILVADDIESNRDLLREALTWANLEVVTADNGQEALSLAREYEPDLIIMDIMMPVMDGISAVKMLKREARTQKIPVFALSAVSGEAKIAELMKTGFDKLLPKPVRISELFNSLTHFLSHTTHNPETVSAREQNNYPTIEEIEKPHELIAVFHNQIFPSFSSLKNAMIMNDISAFGTDIRKLGKVHKIRILEQWGKNIIDLVAIFDIETIDKEFLNFSKICEKLKIIIEEPHA